MSSMIGSRARPLLVSAYSTRGGTSGNVWRSTIALLLEHAQAQRQRARADPRERAFQLTETRAAFGQFAHEQQRPLSAHYLRGPTYRTCLIDGHFDLYFTK